MNTKLANVSVAVLATNGFEESEFTEPIEALKNAGAKVDVISLKEGKIKAWSDKEWSKEYDVDVAISNARERSYDALVLPGGVMNPDQLRTNEQVVDFVTDFVLANKPVAAICHGPWTLIETGEIEGVTMTSFPSIKTDLVNAGVNWVDKEVVVDGNFITSRKPADLKAFCEKLITVLANKSQTSGRR